MNDIYTTLLIISAVRFFIRALFAEVCHPNFGALYGVAMFLPIEGTQTWRP